MGRSDDNNNSNPTMPRIVQGGLDHGTRKVGQNRRALSVINQNVQGRPYPCVVNKRPLSEKYEISEKKQVDPVHRPITRRFAAQIASMQQSCNEEPNKTSLLVSIPNNGFGDAIAIDDGLKKSPAPGDQPVPMSLEQPEPMQMEEVEMEDIVEEPILDIDSCDANNHLAVTDYIGDLHLFYKRIEGVSCVPPNYMAQQFDINERMRAILIDWLIEVHDKFDLMQETLFLTINLIDRFLTKQTVLRKKLQLVGLVAMLLACKYEEVCVPVIGDLIIISDQAYSRKEVLEMEKLILNTLQFNISVPTPFVFMQRFLKAAQADKKLRMLAFFLVELSLVEYEMLKFPPSLLAAAAVYTAQCTVNGFKHWTKTCEWHTNYSEDQLLTCSAMMVGFHQKAGIGKLKGVHRKYNSPKFSYTAKCEPACFLLENQF